MVADYLLRWRDGELEIVECHREEGGDSGMVECCFSSVGWSL